MKFLTKRNLILTTIFIAVILTVVGLGNIAFSQVSPAIRDPEQPCSYVEDQVNLYHVIENRMSGPYTVIECFRLGDITQWGTPETPGEAVEVVDSSTRHSGTMRPADQLVSVKVDWLHVLVQEEGIQTYGVTLKVKAIQSENIIVNSSFEDGQEPWKFHGGGFAELSIVEPGYKDAYAAIVSITGQGDNIQLYQHDLSLEPNTEYRLTFAAQSNTGHDLSVVLHKHSSPFTRYGLDYLAFDITTSWQEFTVDFTTFGFNVPVNDARFRFWFASGGVTGDIYQIDDVVLSKVLEATETPIPPSSTPTFTVEPATETPIPPTDTNTPMPPTFTPTPTITPTNEHQEILDRLGAIETQQALTIDWLTDIEQRINVLETLLKQISELIRLTLGE
jgi:hypothetical protein